MLPSPQTALLTLTTLLLGSTTSQTIYTGDTLQGYPIISSLDITDVPSNTISRFWLSPAEGQGGLPYFLPIFVARGSEESVHSGKRLSLSASIHGDELNPVAVVQKIFARLNETGRFPGSSSSGKRDRDDDEGALFDGTVIGLPTQNPQGNLLNQRNFFTSSSNGFFTNLNRVFPGVTIEEGGGLPDAYAAAIWNDVWGNTTNVDVAVDFRRSPSPFFFRVFHDSFLSFLPTPSRFLVGLLSFPDLLYYQPIHFRSFFFFCSLRNLPFHHSSRSSQRGRERFKKEKDLSPKLLANPILHLTLSSITRTDFHPKAPNPSLTPRPQTPSQPAPSAPYGATPTTDSTACSDSPSC